MKDFCIHRSFRLQNAQPYNELSNFTLQHLQVVSLPIPSPNLFTIPIFCIDHNAHA